MQATILVKINKQENTKKKFLIIHAYPMYTLFTRFKYAGNGTN